MHIKQLGRSTTLISAIGQGTGINADVANPASYDALAQTLRVGIDLGMTFIDTAPAYGEGRCEDVVGQTIQGIRNEVFIATKVSPQDVSYEGVLRSAEASLRRLRTDRIDLYQVHWSNPAVPIGETMRAMSKLVRDGTVRYVGVSNFSLRELRQAADSVMGGMVVSIQDEYSLADRTVEGPILPYCQRVGMTLIAYSPLARGKIARHMGTLRRIAEHHGATPAQVALRWLISREPVVVIPNTTKLERVRENAASADLDLLDAEIEEIDRVCVVRPVQVQTDSIRVDAAPDRAVYRTVKEATENPAGLVPSPTELAEQIKDGEFLKPIRLELRLERPEDGEAPYRLIEGRLRYWAWVIAYGGERPIAALIEGETA